MSRCCEITGKKPQTGNNVSHANNKTKRRFLPNLQEASFYSVALKRSVSVTCTTSGIRTVEHKGGIDGYLLGTAPTKLPAHLRRLRKQIAAKTADEKPAPKAPRAKKAPSKRAAKKKAA